VSGRKTKTGEDENHEFIGKVIKDNQDSLIQDNQKQILYSLMQG